MDFQFTEPEMDAALLLIQLSGDSAESDGAAAKTVEQSGGEESVGDSYEISSAGELEILPRRRGDFDRSMIRISRIKNHEGICNFNLARPPSSRADSLSFFLAPSSTIQSMRSRDPAGGEFDCDNPVKHSCLIHLRFHTTTFVRRAQRSSCGGAVFSMGSDPYVRSTQSARLPSLVPLCRDARCRWCY
ncbi:hypothetical protein BUALT_Bualt15G0075400 [Buddleja alternifolia]|uniref:Uncharacterized protein n=1 Tax=Buddleja alternifolia TaxID=168488 RepID=A0AAV6WDZ6_9LAMI|nr:hypothetical protein BUALT_Bualt15G0075400 [Buddleja alternifolia]